jgi:hypothetical protein
MAKMVQTDMPFTAFSMEADRDYILARFINFLGDACASRAGYFAQAACEKYMKAFSVQEAQQYLERHSLIDVADSCARFNAYFSESATREALRKFDAFEQVGRYGAHAKFDPLSVQTDQLQTAGVWIWDNTCLATLDSLVFRVRGMLRFDACQGMDALQAILTGNSQNYFVATWKGPPLIKVLTTNNQSFVAKPAS